MENILNVLMYDTQLAGYFSNPPQAITMPFAKDGTKHYIAVILFVKENALHVRILAEICSKVISRLVFSRALADYQGIEVLFCSNIKGTTMRILRLSVPASGFEYAMNLKFENLKRSQPDDVYTYFWYVNDIPD